MMVWTVKAYEAGTSVVDIVIEMATALDMKADREHVTAAVTTALTVKGCKNPEESMRLVAPVMFNTMPEDVLRIFFDALDLQWSGKGGVLRLSAEVRP